MLDTEKTLRDRGVLDVIQTLSSNRESGTLLMRTGTTAGAFFFRNGLLVDAHVGNLSGFQAINAAASLRDASFSFDPSVTPPAFSSITPSERVVLKQFFGIDTVAPEEFHEQEPLIADEQDEVTLVSSNVRSDEPPIAPPYTLPSTPLNRSGLGVAAVVFVLATAAVILLYKFGDKFGEYQSATSVASEAVVATNIQPSSPPVVEPVKPQVTPINGAPRAIDRPVSVTPIDHGTSAAPELTGRWNIVNIVQKTSYNSYNNLKIGFDLSIKQNGKGFTGTGVKISENGRSLPASSRTPIQVRGSIDGDKVEATFFEQGTARKTNGRFVWRMDKTGGLNGTFNTNAARSSGKSTARKV